VARAKPRLAQLTPTAWAHSFFEQPGSGMILEQLRIAGGAPLGFGRFPPKQGDSHPTREV
jgi:hypothetical protein